MKWKHGIINRPFVKDHVGKRGQGSQNSGPTPTRIPNFIPLNSILLPFPKYKLYRISSWQSGLIWILTRKPTGFDISAVSLDKWYIFFCIWLFISQSKIISSVSASSQADKVVCGRTVESSWYSGGGDFSNPTLRCPHPVPRGSLCVPPPLYLCTSPSSNGWYQNFLPLSKRK